MTRYLVLASQELLDRDDLTFPAGFRFVEVAERSPVYAGFRVVHVEDDFAPVELEGCLVDVTLQRDVVAGTVTVGSRQAVRGGLT